MENNLKQLRKRVKLSQQDVASALKVSKQTVYKWEQGKAQVAPVHFEGLKSLLRVGADELERALVQTLFDAACEEGTDRVLLNARASRRYSVPLLNAALNRFHAGSAPSVQAAPLELREEILRLREENLKLREHIFELEQMLNIPSGGVSTVLKSSSNHELETVK